MGKSNFAVFVDLENAGGKESMLRSIIEKVKIRGDILLGKVYGYTDRYSDLKECLLSNTFSVVPSLRYGKCQKNNLDIQLVIDAMEVAYTNPLIDSFCIVSGDSDYTPLVGRLKAMGKTVLGISRSEAASGIFINACNEFVFLESVAAKKQPKPKKGERIVDGDLNELIGQVETIVEDQDEEQMYASELKDTLTRLRPDFSERSYGCSTFGKLVALIASKSDKLSSWTEDSSLMIGLSGSDESSARMDKSNWLHAFTQALNRFKSEGKSLYPEGDHSVRLPGFRRAPDRLQALQRRDEGAGKAGPAGHRNGRSAHHAAEDLLKNAHGKSRFRDGCGIFCFRQRSAVSLSRRALLRPLFFPFSAGTALRGAACHHTADAPFPQAFSPLASQRSAASLSHCTFSCRFSSLLGGNTAS